MEVADTGLVPKVGVGSLCLSGEMSITKACEEDISPVSKVLLRISKTRSSGENLDVISGSVLTESRLEKDPEDDDMEDKKLLLSLMTISVGS